MEEWVETYGEVPMQMDWNPAQARSRGDENRAVRFEAANGRWPNAKRVYDRFGSWEAGVRAALGDGPLPRAPRTDRSRGCGVQCRGRGCPNTLVIPQDHGLCGFCLVELGIIEERELVAA